MSPILSTLKPHRFAILSWLVTAALVLSLLGGAFWWKSARAADSALVPLPTAGPQAEAPAVTLPLPPVAGVDPSVGRHIQLITNIPAEMPRYEPIKYTVERGDAMSKIAEKFKIEAVSILYNNKDVLKDDPHGLKPGMVLVIPPVDGIIYTWKEGDTLEKVAGEFKADVEEIIDFPGNDVDLTNPDFKPGMTVMIPGGSRTLDTPTIATITRGDGTGTSPTGGNSCGGGAMGDHVFGWPTSGPHTISGNGYTAGHLAIDISANEGDAVFAADAGVVTMAGWSEYGYGYVVQIDHGDGWSSLYAHLSGFGPGIEVCSSVGQGAIIGYAGNTGNSFGAHLHFEIRLGGANVNPLDFVQ